MEVRRIGIRLLKERQQKISNTGVAVITTCVRQGRVDAEGLNDMRPKNHYPFENGGHDRSSNRFDLFYYEKVGERFYLRLTPLATALILGLTLLSIAGMVFLFFYNSGRALPMTDVNVRGANPPAAAVPQNTIIMPAKPTPRPPRAVTPTPQIRRGEKGQEGASPIPLPSVDIKATPVKSPPKP